MIKIKIKRKRKRYKMMNEVWERNYKNSEKIRNRRRRILINRIMNQHKVDLLEKKYEEIMKEWNSMKKKSNVNYK